MTNTRRVQPKQKVKENIVNPSKRIMIELQTLEKVSRLAQDSKIDDHKQNACLISEPNGHDVLCGRGNFVNNHAGNSYFRRLVKHYKIDYISCPKREKKKFSKIIYERIKQLDPPGKFLKYEPNSSEWIDVGEKKAIEKIRQALREGAPNLINSLRAQENEKETSTLEGCEHTGQIGTACLQPNVCTSKVGLDATNINESAKKTMIGCSPAHPSIKECNEICFPACTNNQKKSSTFSHTDFGIQPNSSKSVLNIDVKPTTVGKDRQIILNNKNLSRNRSQCPTLEGLPGPRIIPKRYF